MKKAKRLIAATTATLLSITAVPAFAQDITDKVYVSNAIENTLKRMSADDSLKVYQEIAKGAYNQKMNITLKDYTLPENVLQKDLLDGYSILLDTNCNPITFDMFYNAALKNPKGDSISVNYMLKDSAFKISVPEIMDYYVNIDKNALGQAGAATDSLDIQRKTKEIQKQMENLKNEVEIKVLGANEADAALTQAQVILKASSVNKFVQDYMSLYQLPETEKIPDLLKNDIVVDLTINKENIVTAFSTTINEQVVEQVYDYDEVTNEPKEKSVTKNNTFAIDATYNNDQLNIQFSGLEDDKKVVDIKYVNQDSRDEALKLTASKANIVITAEEQTLLTIDMDAVYQADGYTNVAVNANTQAKPQQEGVEAQKHTVSVTTSYKTDVLEKEIKIHMPSFVVQVDDMRFDFALEYSLASKAFTLPEVKTVNMQDISEEATTQLSIKALAQLYKVLPEVLMNQFVGNK